MFIVGCVFSFILGGLVGIMLTCIMSINKSNENDER